MQEIVVKLCPDIFLAASSKRSAFMFPPQVWHRNSRSHQVPISRAHHQFDSSTKQREVTETKAPKVYQPGIVVASLSHLSNGANDDVKVNATWVPHSVNEYSQTSVYQSLHVVNFAVQQNFRAIEPVYNDADGNMRPEYWSIAICEATAYKMTSKQ